jgi:glucose dehydrogenase
MVWRWRMPDHEIMEANDGIGSKFPNEVTPIVVNGVLYSSTPLNVVVALDAGTGEELWRFDPEAWREESTTFGLHRGVSFWSDGEGNERVVFGTFTGYMYSLDAHTGQPDATFGEEGRIDLTQGLGRPVERWAYAHPSPPIICRDVIVTGSAIQDVRVQNKRQPEITPPGDVRGYDVRTGELLWTFHAIPREGEFGADTWEEGAWKEFGAANVWSMMSADEELGYVYLPFGTPSNDFLRRGPARGQPVRGQHRLPRRANRQAGVALSAGSPWIVGLRHAGRTGAVGHRRRRATDQSRGAGDETGFLFRFRSRYGGAGVADRGACGTSVDGARGAGLSNPAVSNAAVAF